MDFKELVEQNQAKSKGYPSKVEHRVTIPHKEYKTAIVGIGYESLREAPRSVKGWLGHVDMCIMGDGKFDYFPGEHDYSEDGWLDVIEKMCKETNTEFIGYQYAGDQQTKRQMYLDIAGKAKVDFAITVDTEEYIDPSWSNFERFWPQLIMLSEFTKDRMFAQWQYIPDETLWSRQGNAFPSNKWLHSARIHKDPGTMRYCMNSHYIWCPKNITDEALIKWQMKNRDQTNPYQFIAKNVIDGVRIRMDRTLRTPEYNAKQEEWAHMNQHSENSKTFYAISKARGNPPPPGFDSWDAWQKKKHTFDRKTGQRIELE